MNRTTAKRVSSLEEKQRPGPALMPFENREALDAWRAEQKALGNTPAQDTVFIFTGVPNPTETISTFCRKPGPGEHHGP